MGTDLFIVVMADAFCGPCPYDSVAVVSLNRLSPAFVNWPRRESGGTLKCGQGGQELTRMRNSAVLPFYMRCSYCCCFSCVRVYIAISVIDNLTKYKL